MRVTVAICTRNRAALLDRTLAGLHGLVVPPGVDWEVLVVDNGGTDDTPAVLRRHAGRLPLRAAAEPRPGITHARRRGVAAARGEAILWTDDDTRVDPQWMAAYLDAFARFDADLVFGTIRPDWVAGPPAWFVPELGGLFGLLDHGGAARPVDAGHVGHNANLGFTRRLLAATGGYRESPADRYGGKGEDIDLSQRAHRAGLTVVYQPAAVRRRAWADAPNHLHRLAEDAATMSSLFGLPRYLFRVQAGNLRRWAGCVARRDRGRAFAYELKLIHWASVLYHAAVARPPAAVPTDDPGPQVPATP